ncbi:cupin domain-containing protein [Haloparvum sedimenti]|uniref:cupin domain-containing protein n=1 Tax=Haloparvum sedimenti TaxID=1678448 RepID=UPI00071E7200|nr:cupin domain-containing protein [Haloparvum sedimenti]
MSDTDGDTDPDGDTDGGAAPEPVIRRDGEIEYEVVGAADGMGKGVLIGEEHGAPNFALRKFLIEPDGTVPRHTNEVEHVQYVLAGDYVVGIGDEEHRVGPGDSLLIPAGVEHWYENDGTTRAAFLCTVPHGDDAIELVEE